MRKSYSGFYRSCLTEDEKRLFKRLALERGSVTSVHDSLLRDYISKRLREEAEDDPAGQEAMR